MVVTLGVDAILSGLSCSLRYTSILFVRWHPIGPRYLPILCMNLATYITLVSLRWFTWSRNSRGKSYHPLAIVTLGVIDGYNYFANLLTIFVNILCLMVALDFVYRAHWFHTAENLSFSRVGFVDSSSARIVLRAPGSPTIQVGIMPWLEDTYHMPPSVVHMSEESDWVGTLVIEDLLPDTVYVFSSNASHSGQFQTTKESPKRWSMVQTSCLKPFFPYNPVDHSLRIKGLEHVSEYIQGRAMEFMLFLGDFIYIDLPYPLGWTLADYTSAYRQVYASPSWTNGLLSLPWLHIYDDHEIVNDWSANETRLYQDAIQPYWHYQGRANPVSTYGLQESYYTFTRGDVAFFLLDTRRYRSDSTLDDGVNKTMLGSAQLKHLREWLITESRWKVVISSVPFTKNWRGPDSADAWTGYMHEREAIFSYMRATDGVVLLSGDRHEHATTLFPPPLSSDNSTHGVPLIEFSTSALNQFHEPFNRFHREIEETDVSVHHHWRGTSKFAILTFDTSEPQRLVVDFELVVDGEKSWDYQWTYQR